MIFKWVVFVVSYLVFRLALSSADYYGHVIPSNNLLLYISQVAVGRLLQLSVYGDDCPTVDGTGYSVLQMVSVFEEASGRSVPYQIVGRRPGDIAVCYADPTYAYESVG